MKTRPIKTMFLSEDAPLEGGPCSAWSVIHDRNVSFVLRLLYFTYIYILLEKTGDFLSIIFR